MPKELSNALLINHPLELSEDEKWKLTYRSLAVTIVLGFLWFVGLGLVIFST